LGHQPFATFTAPFQIERRDARDVRKEKPDPALRRIKEAGSRRQELFLTRTVVLDGSIGRLLFSALNRYDIGRINQPADIVVVPTA
jgi:hypothetical protein